MIDQKIIDFIKENGEIHTSELAATFKVSRQSAAKWMKKLIDEGIVIKLGSTRSARYLLATTGKAPISGRKLTKSFDASYTLRKLNEDDVFRELDLKLGLQKNLSSQSYKIIVYAFTEMLNNAIDHSQSKKAQVRFRLDKNTATFAVQDFGVGIYRNLQKSFSLASEFDAISHLLKGKQTTAPSHHSGQGIFFTSKAVDRFKIQSSTIRLVIDNLEKDTFVEETSKQKGTLVEITQKLNSRRSLAAIFAEYSNEDLEFSTTKVIVKLSARPDENISRSQARKILFGLDKFETIVLDFDQVKGIGQGFSDEVFRIFQRNNPKKIIEIQNANKAVNFMIERNLSELKSSR